MSIELQSTTGGQLRSLKVWHLSDLLIYNMQVMARITLLPNLSNAISALANSYERMQFSGLHSHIFCTQHVKFVTNVKVPKLWSTPRFYTGAFIISAVP